MLCGENRSQTAAVKTDLGGRRSLRLRRVREPRSGSRERKPRGGGGGACRFPSPWCRVANFNTRVPQAMDLQSGPSVVTFGTIRLSKVRMRRFMPPFGTCGRQRRGPSSARAAMHAGSPGFVRVWSGARRLNRHSFFPGRRLVVLNTVSVWDLHPSRGRLCARPIAPHVPVWGQGMLPHRTQSALPYSTLVRRFLLFVGVRMQRGHGCRPRSARIAYAKRRRANPRSHRNLWPLGGWNQRQKPRPRATIGKGGAPGGLGHGGGPSNALCPAR